MLVAARHWIRGLRRPVIRWRVLVPLLVSGTLLMGLFSTLPQIVDRLRNVTFLRSVQQHEQAVWVETLLGNARLVLNASSSGVRDDAWSKVQQLHREMTTNQEPVFATKVRRAFDALQNAMAEIDEAWTLRAARDRLLARADELIGEVSNSLNAIVSDSDRYARRVTSEILNASEEDVDLLLQELELAMDESTVAQDLYSTLETGRRVLGRLPRLEDEETVDQAQAQFRSIGERLRVRVRQLQGNSDYEHLPSLVDAFVSLDDAFDMRRRELVARQAAAQASELATRRLSLLRENLVADAGERLALGLGVLQQRLQQTFWVLVITGVLILAVETQSGRKRQALSPTQPARTATTADEAAGQQLLRLQVAAEELLHLADGLPDRLTRVPDALRNEVDCDHHPFRASEGPRGDAGRQAEAMVAVALKRALLAVSRAHDPRASGEERPEPPAREPLEVTLADCADSLERAHEHIAQAIIGVDGAAAPVGIPHDASASSVPSRRDAVRVANLTSDRVSRSAHVRARDPRRQRDEPAAAASALHATAATAAMAASER